MSLASSSQARTFVTSPPAASASSTVSAGLTDRTRAAKALGVSRVTLWKWLKEHQVQVETVVRE